MILFTIPAILNARDIHGHTALHVAANKNHADFARMLIQAGINIDEKDIEEDTALHAATNRNHLEIAIMLIQAGADLDAKNKQGCTAMENLDLVTFNNYFENVLNAM